ncbi:MAG TPA: MFS transporter [Jatrophihabitans sp.]
MASGEWEPLTGGRAWLAMLVIGFGALSVSVSQSVLVPVLPNLPAVLHTSTATAEWLLTATLLVGAVSVPIFGRLGDMFGKRALFLVALGGLVLGAILAVQTNNVALLIIARAIQGTALAAIPLGIGLISSLVPRDKAVTAMAVVSAMLGVGGALGLPMAGVIAQHSDFHVLFWVIGIAGALSVVATLFLVPEAPGRPGGRVDVPGSVLLGAMLTAVLLALSEGTTWGWGSPLTLSLLVISVPLAVGFARYETRIALPIVDLRAAARRPIVLTNCSTLLMGVAMFAALIGTAPYVQAPRSTGYGFGSSIIVSGLCVLPCGLFSFIFAPMTARLLRKVGADRTLALGGLTVAVGWLLRIFATGSLWEIVLGSTILGAGSGIGYASMPTLIGHYTDLSSIAAANGINSLSRTLGGAIATSVGGSLLSASTVLLAGQHWPSLTAYRMLFILCAGAGVLAAVLAIRIGRPGAEPQSA